MAKQPARTPPAEPPLPPHGFYARGFAPAELRDLDAEAGARAGLRSEIAMLRVLIRRVFEQAVLEEEDLETAALALTSLGLAANRVALLLRADQQLGRSGGDLTEAFSAAIDTILKEMEA